ncbi:MAG: phosphate ABC transporter substrate-binding protein [Eubacteriales bacterium]|jgi:phosphate transport system substrate-binding protein
MKSRKASLIMAGILSAAMVAAGCGSSTDSTTDTSATADTSATTTEAAATEEATTDSTASTSTTASGDLSGTVSTDGSTSMEKVITILSEQFQNDNPGVTVTYNPTGSSSGITAASEGSADLGLASRDLKDDDPEGLTATTIAIDGIAIIVNPENDLSDISLDDIAKVYTDQINNWSDLGGTDGDIVCIGREAGSGTRDGFESITDTKDSCVLDQELTSTGDVIQTVANNPNAIGYASMADLNDTVKTLTVDGVAPSEETVLDGTYKIQRNFNVITNDSKTLSPAAQAFFDYITSADAADLISQAGAVPVATSEQ